MLTALVLSSCSADCVWYGRAVAWIDENENGYMDAREIPLEGIPVHVDDIHNQYIDVADPVTTDEFGEARLDVGLIGCSDVDFEVYTDVPEGYRLTTNSRLEASKTFWGNLELDATYFFGFIPVSK
jgi:hypothetical protein